MSNTVFYFGIILLVTLVSRISATCLRFIDCPCGNKGKPSYTQCIEDTSTEENVCERWENCATCKANIPYCLTCPPNRYGPSCAEACGSSRLQSEVKIPEGRSAVAGEFPWVVFLYMNETEQICGGVLVDHTTVLTGANCVEEDQHSTLYFGKISSFDQDDNINVENRMSSRIIIHPEYNGVTFNNNIAIVKFHPAVSYSERIRPICMPSPHSSAKNLVPGQIGYVIGWWRNNYHLITPNLTVVPIPIQASETCEAAYKKRDIDLKVTGGMVCAGFTDQNNSVCRGSSGSPLVFYDRITDSFTMEGLVSHGTHGICNLPERYTLYTRVLYYVDWIFQNL